MVIHPRVLAILRGRGSCHSGMGMTHRLRPWLLPSPPSSLGEHALEEPPRDIHQIALRHDPDEMAVLDHGWGGERFFPTGGNAFAAAGNQYVGMFPDYGWDNIECRWGSFTTGSSWLNLSAKDGHRGKVTVDPDIMDKDISIDANAVDQYDPNNWGDPNDLAEPRRYTRGTAVALTVQVNPGSKFTKWKVLGPNDSGDPNYQEVIAKAREVYNAGARHILLDMSDVPFMASSGLVALHSIAVLLRGEEPPDPESGWGAFHAIDRDRDAGLQQHIKLLNPQPEVDRVLEMSGLKEFFEVHTNQETAVASF